METTKNQRAGLLAAIECRKSAHGAIMLGADMVSALCRDVDTLVEMLGRAALGQETHIRSFHDPLCGECLGCQARAILGPSQGEAGISVAPGTATVDDVKVDEVPLPVAATCRDCGWELKQNLDPPYTWTVACCYPAYHLVHLFHGPPMPGLQIAAVAIDKHLE